MNLASSLHLKTVLRHSFPSQLFIPVNCFFLRSLRDSVVNCFQDFCSFRFASSQNTPISAKVASGMVRP